MSASWPQLLLIAVVIVLLFGRGKISDLMGDVAKGINSFKKGLKDEDDGQTIEHAKTEVIHEAKEKSDAS